MSVNVSKISRILIDSINRYDYQVFSSIINDQKLDSNLFENVQKLIKHQINLSISDIDRLMSDIGKKTTMLSLCINIPSILIDYYPPWMIVPILTGMCGSGALIYGNTKLELNKNNLNSIFSIKKI